MPKLSELQNLPTADSNDLIPILDVSEALPQNKNKTIKVEDLLANTTTTITTSPNFTGTPTSPTPSSTDNSTKIATTQFVNNKLQSLNIEDLNNVSTNAPTTNQVLQYNGTEWVNANNVSSSSTSWGSITGTLTTQTDLNTALNLKADSTHTHLSSNITDLSTTLNSKADVIHNHLSTNITDFNEAVDDRVATLLTAGSNVTLNYNDTTNALTINSTSAGATNLDSLSDVVVSSPTTNQLLQYNGTNWVNSTISGSSGNLDSLTDTTITSAQVGQTLYYNGTAWVNGQTGNIPLYVAFNTGSSYIVTNKKDTILIDNTSNTASSITLEFRNVHSDLGGYTTKIYLKKTNNLATILFIHEAGGIQMTPASINVSSVIAGRTIQVLVVGDGNTSGVFFTYAQDSL